MCSTPKTSQYPDLPDTTIALKHRREFAERQEYGAVKVYFRRVAATAATRCVGGGASNEFCSGGWGERERERERGREREREGDGERGETETSGEMLLLCMAGV